MIMKRVMQWVLASIFVCGASIFASCSKGGDVIYEPDPADEASTSPLVAVIYDPNALGDRGYNDLIYQGVEKAARKYHLRTMQLSPLTVDEGLAYLQMMFQSMSAAEDSIRRLFIVAAASYDGYLRKNNSRLESNPYADLLYLETATPLAGKGSTLYLSYFGAMFEAGAIAPVEATDVLLVGANPKAKTIAAAIQGFTDGFQNSPIEVSDNTEKKLVTVYLSDEVSGGFAVADTTVMQLMNSVEWNDDRHLLVPVCGGSATVFHRFSEMLDLYDYVGIDSVATSSHCNFSIVKHIDRAVQQCIEQWLSPEGMPKHQTFGLADDYTGVVIHPYTEDSKMRFERSLSKELRQSIHQEAIRKEAEYEN